MNKVVHFELPVDDVSRSIKFYKELFGWEINPVPNMPYHIVKTGETDENNMMKEKGVINGGIYERGDGSAANSPVIVISVDSLDEHLQKAENAGSKVVLPKREVGDMGYYAQITDTEGNILGLWQDIKK